MTKEGYCFVCGRWHKRLRLFSLAKNGEYIVCWLCDECEILEV